MATYHKYIFDTEKRAFLGKFEEMYQNEDKEGYDSWHQSDANILKNKISETILGQYQFKTIADIGCGKGSFTSRLKQVNNYVLGVDLSETAIKKAKQNYSEIDFQTQTTDEFLERQPDFDLVVCMETLSYLENWKTFLKEVSGKCQYLYLTLYLPENPIGYVKSFTDLEQELEMHYSECHRVLTGRDTLLYLGKSKNI